MLSTNQLAGTDRGCCAKCKRELGRAILEWQVRERSPAAQLAAVSSHYLGLFIRYFVSKAKRTVFESMVC